MAAILKWAYEKKIGPSRSIYHTMQKFSWLERSHDGPSKLVGLDEEFNFKFPTVVSVLILTVCSLVKNIGHLSMVSWGVDLRVKILTTFVNCQ